MAYKYTGGLFLDNKRADEVRTSLKEQFSLDRKTFLERMTLEDDARIQELITLERPHVRSIDARPALTHIRLWHVATYTTALGDNPDLDIRGNIVQPVDLVYSSNDTPPNMATQGALLAAQPEGRRCVRLANYSQPFCGIHLIPTDESGTWRNCMFNREFDHETRQGPFMDRWLAAISAADSVYRTCIQDLYDYGASIYGTADAQRIVDCVYWDVEKEAKMSSYYLLEGTGTDIWAQIFADDEWPDFRDRLVRPRMPQTYWDEFVGMRYWIEPYSDVRCFLWDTWFQTYYNNNINTMMELWGGPFDLDDLDLSNYESAQRAASTISFGQAAGSNSNVLGVGGELITSTFHLYGTYNGAYPSRWYWPSGAEQNLSGGSADELMMGALLISVSGLRQLIAGSQRKKFLWIARHDEGSLGDTTDGVWNDWILHAALLIGSNDQQPNGGILYYNSDGDGQDHQDVVDLIAERDEVCGVMGGVPIIRGQVSANMRPAFVLSSFMCGGRIVHRVTPSTAATGNALSQTGSTLVFTNSLGSLIFTNSRVHPSSQSDIAPLGYWIEEFPVADDAALIGADSGRLLPIGRGGA